MMRLPTVLNIALALAAPCVAASSASAQPAAAARVVFADVFVAGDTGVPVIGLRPADLGMLVDGASVPIVECALPRAGSQQLTVALVVDEAAVPQQRLAALAGADGMLRDILSGGRSRLAVVSWGATARVVQPFTADPARAARALAAPANASTGATGAGTLESVVGGIGALPGRKAIVVVGGLAPGTPERSGAFRSLAECANGAGVTLYWIDTSAGPPPGGDGAVEATAAAARAAAEATGGLAVTRSDDLSAALSKAVSDLKGAWRVGFVPSSRPDGALHRLDVKARRAGIGVRARTAFADLDDERLMAERTAAALLLGYEDNPLGVQVSLTSERNPRDGTQVITVLVTIPLGSLEFQPKAMSHDCDLTLWLAARDGAGQVIRAPKAKFPVSVPNDRVLTALTQTAGYTFRVPMKAGPATVAVTVRDEIGTQSSTTVATAAASAEAATGATP